MNYYKEIGKEKEMHNLRARPYLSPPTLRTSRQQSVPDFNLSRFVCLLQFGIEIASFYVGAITQKKVRKQWRKNFKFGLVY